MVHVLKICPRANDRRGTGGRVDEGPFDRLNDRDFDRVRLLSTRAGYFTSQLMKLDYTKRHD